MTSGFSIHTIAYAFHFLFQSTAVFQSSEKTDGVEWNYEMCVSANGSSKKKPQIMQAEIELGKKKPSAKHINFSINFLLTFFYHSYSYCMLKFRADTSQMLWRSVSAFKFPPWNLRFFFGFRFFNWFPGRSAAQCGKQSPIFVLFPTKPNKKHKFHARIIKLCCKTIKSKRRKMLIKCLSGF